MHNPFPIYSIITPTCNRPEMLRRNILSVIGQTYSNYEHIIIDDSSDCNVHEIISEYNDGRIVYLKHDDRKGAAASYNTGIRNSLGKFLTFLDDDDEYMPEYLDRVNKCFSSDRNDIGFVWTSVAQMKNGEGGARLHKIVDWKSSFRSLEDSLIAATCIGNGYGVCIKRECIDIIGLYDESLKMAVDTDFLFRLAQNFRFTYIPEILVRIHLHEFSQMTDNIFNQERIRCYELIMDRNKKILNKYPFLSSVHLESVAGLCYKSNNKSKARKLYFSMIKNTPSRLKIYPDFLAYELTGQNFTSTFIGKSIKRFLLNIKSVWKNSAWK